MKTALFALFLGASTIASATPVQPLSGSDLSLSAASGSSTFFETKARARSKRVGGNGRSGKGSRYVGGHK